MGTGRPSRADRQRVLIGKVHKVYLILEPDVDARRRASTRVDRYSRSCSGLWACRPGAGLARPGGLTVLYSRTWTDAGPRGPASSHLPECSVMHAVEPAWYGLWACFEQKGRYGPRWKGNAAGFPRPRYPCTAHN